MKIQFSLNNLEAAVVKFWQQAKDYKVIAFIGDLGAGKTTFITNLCKHIGVQDEISSPTFSIINEYKFTNERGMSQTIYHSDWYRLKDEQEAIGAGIEDILQDEQAYHFIEWPQNAAGLLPDNTLIVTINTIDENTRTLHTSLLS